MLITQGLFLRATTPMGTAPDLSLLISPPGSNTDTSQPQTQLSLSIPIYNSSSSSSSSSLTWLAQMNSSTSTWSNLDSYTSFLNPISGGDGGKAPNDERLHILNHEVDNELLGIGSMEASRSPMRSRLMLKIPAVQRSMRAPRMRWTTALHARFVRAIDLLGGHERATPKSVLELMDVKHLTLAHVKSHLQMYRTVKTTDKAAVFSGQSDGSGEDDLAPDLGFGDTMRVHETNYCSIKWSRPSRGTQLLSNSSDMDERRLSNFQSHHEINGLSSPSSFKEIKRPSLEFTLGRPDWQSKK